MDLEAHTSFRSSFLAAFGGLLVPKPWKNATLTSLRLAFRPFGRRHWQPRLPRGTAEGVGREESADRGAGGTKPELPTGGLRGIGPAARGFKEILFGAPLAPFGGVLH